MRVDIDAPEFTSLCPITGQPDYARFVISYWPRERCVESKSLKLYLGSFRSEGQFHEAITNTVANDLWKLLDPSALLVIGKFLPRGGIAFQPRVELLATEIDPAGLWEGVR